MTMGMTMMMTMMMDDDVMMILPLFQCDDVPHTYHGPTICWHFQDWPRRLDRSREKRAAAGSLNETPVI